MNLRFEQHILNVMSGRETGFRPAAVRAMLRSAEPFYCGAVRARNALFNYGIKSSRRLNRPVISIGNITTGGTGKTPMVRWLAETLRAEGNNVAILSRGYRAQGQSLGDELAMLDSALNEPGQRRVCLKSNANRYEAGNALLSEHPEIDLFLLDDGFQHRQLWRNFDLVLISALEPFGFGHVLPRGLLREPLDGLRRADAVVVTHANQVGGESLEEMSATIRKHNAAAPVYRAIHLPVGLLSTESPDVPMPMDRLSDLRFFAFSGIGSPDSFERQFERFGPNLVGRRRFGDHHGYSPADLSALVAEAQRLGAQVLVTTEKDWVKVADFRFDMPIWRLAMRVQFLDDDGQHLMAQIRQTIGRAAQ